MSIPGQHGQMFGHLGTWLVFWALGRLSVVNKPYNRNQFWALISSNPLAAHIFPLYGAAFLGRKKTSRFFTNFKCSFIMTNPLTKI